MLNLKYRRLNKFLLPKDLKRIVMVVCSNTHKFHPTLYMRYIFWREESGGVTRTCMLDDPTFEEACDIVNRTGLQIKNWIIVEADCFYCRKDVPE